MPVRAPSLRPEAILDAVPLAESMLEQGFLMAPGSLFSPDQRPSSWMRLNVATSLEPRMLSALQERLEHGMQRLKFAGPPR